MARLGGAFVSLLGSLSRLGRRHASSTRGDTAWLLAAVCAGPADGARASPCSTAGMVRSKSVLNMMMMTFGSLAVISIAVGAGRLLDRVRRRREVRTARRPHRSTPGWASSMSPDAQRRLDASR